MVMKKIWTIGGLSAALILVAGGAAVATVGAQPTTPEPVETSVSVPLVTPTPTVTPEAPAAVVPETPVEVVVEPPAPPAPEPPYSNSGQQVPFYPSSDPENAGGGEYADPGSWCTSGSASGSVPICD